MLLVYPIRCIITITRVPRHGSDFPYGPKSDTEYHQRLPLAFVVNDKCQMYRWKKKESIPSKLPMIDQHSPTTSSESYISKPEYIICRHLPAALEISAICSYAYIAGVSWDPCNWKQAWWVGGRWGKIRFQPWSQDSPHLHSGIFIPHHVSYLSYLQYIQHSSHFSLCLFYIFFYCVQIVDCVSVYHSDNLLPLGNTVPVIHKWECNFLAINTSNMITCVSFTKYFYSW